MTGSDTRRKLAIGAGALAASWLLLASAAEILGAGDPVRAASGVVVQAALLGFWMLAIWAFLRRRLVLAAAALGGLLGLDFGTSLLLSIREEPLLATVGEETLIFVALLGVWWLMTRRREARS